MADPVARDDGAPQPARVDVPVQIVLRENRSVEAGTSMPERGACASGAPPDTIAQASRAANRSRTARILPSESDAIGYRPGGFSFARRRW